MIRRFLASTQGTVAVSTAVLLILLIGITGLGAEASLWYQTKRSMQGAADAAAISAAYALTGAGSCISGSACGWAPGLHGLAVAAENGWQYSASNGTQVKVVSPPTKSGSPLLGNASAVEVWITQAQPTILFGAVDNIVAPTIGAYAIAAAVPVTKPGADCVLALANATNAVQVDGNGDLSANCGIAIDGGLDQNPGTPVHGGIHFNGAPAKVHISNLIVASSSTECPSASHCFLYNSTTALPTANVKTSAPTADPYASLAFPTPPLGVRSLVLLGAGGSGYTNGTRTFTVVGGTRTFAAKFTATVSGGKVTAAGIAVTDPGAYTVMPTNPVSVTADTGGGSGATFTLTEGCFSWPSGATPLPGRKYCSINLNGANTTNFPAGAYYIAGGDSGCVGFCVSSANATVTSDSAGVTFYLTNGEGAGSFGTTSYARLDITSANTTLCAPGTACGTTCTGSCVLFFQNPAATTTTSLDAGGSGPTPAATNNTFQGNGTSTLTGLIYLPRQTFSMNGNSSIAGCTGVIAKYLDIGGTPAFSNGCLPGNGIGSTTTIKSTLSE
jgi:hypothetical protein